MQAHPTATPTCDSIYRSDLWVASRPFNLPPYTPYTDCMMFHEMNINGVSPIIKGPSYLTQLHPAAAAAAHAAGGKAVNRFMLGSLWNLIVGWTSLSSRVGSTKELLVKEWWGLLAGSVWLQDSGGRWQHLGVHIKWGIAKDYSSRKRTHVMVNDGKNL